MPGDPIPSPEREWRCRNDGTLQTLPVQVLHGLDPRPEMFRHHNVDGHVTPALPKPVFGAYNE